MKKKILITGVAGFIGSSLARRLLKEGYGVAGLDRPRQSRTGRVPEGVALHEADIRSKDIHPFFENVDVVFHLAAESDIRRCHDDPVATADMNIMGAVNVFEAARKAKVRKVIYAGSSALYEGIGTLPTPETSVKPESFYAISKLGQRMFAEAYRRHFGTVFTELVYFNVYGPGHGFIHNWITLLLRRQPPRIDGDGTRRIDLIHIDDVNDFNLLCLADGRTDNETYNVGSSRNYSIKEIYGKVVELAGVTTESHFNRDAERQPNTLADITKAKSLGWQPKIDLETGLREMIEYARSQVSAAKKMKLA